MLLRVSGSEVGAEGMNDKRVSAADELARYEPVDASYMKLSGVMSYSEHGKWVDLEAAEDIIHRLEARVAELERGEGVVAAVGLYVEAHDKHVELVEDRLLNDARGNSPDVAMAKAGTARDDVRAEYRDYLERTAEAFGAAMEATDERQGQ